MIVKENKKTGPSFKSILYILGGEKDEPQHVRIVACSDVMISRPARRIIERMENTSKGKMVRKKEVRKIAKKLAVPFDLRAQMASAHLKTPNQGYIVSFAPEDRDKIAREPEQSILFELLQMIGVHGDISVRRRRHKKTYYEKIQRKAMFVAVGHTETNCYHWHIFASRIDSDGRANETSFEHRRIVKACRTLSKKYGIRMEALPDEEAMAANVNPGYQVKRKMRQAVMEAKNSACSMEEFEKVLMNKGIQVVPQKTGLCFQYVARVGDKGNTRSNIYSGTQLSRDLTFPLIKEAIAANAEKVRKAQNAPRTHEQKIEYLKRYFGFKDHRHLRYIFTDKSKVMVFRPMDTFPTADLTNFWMEKYEGAARTLKEEYGFREVSVAGPSDYYEELLRVNETENEYNLGDIIFGLGLKLDIRAAHKYVRRDSSRRPATSPAAPPIQNRPQPTLPESEHVEPGKTVLPERQRPKAHPVHPVQKPRGPKL